MAWRLKNILIIIEGLRKVQNECVTEWRASVYNASRSISGCSWYIPGVWKSEC